MPLKSRWGRSRHLNLRVRLGQTPALTEQPEPAAWCPLSEGGGLHLQVRLQAEDHLTHLVTVPCLGNL